MRPLMLAGVLIFGTLAGCGQNEPRADESMNSRVRAKSGDSERQAQAEARPFEPSSFDRQQAVADRQEKGDPTVAESPNKETAAHGKKPKHPRKHRPKQKNKASARTSQAPAETASPNTEPLKLADGTILHLKKWGKTYEAYEWHKPLKVDDPSVETILERGPEIGIGELNFDPKREKMYWIESYSRSANIVRTNLDGSHPELLVDGLKRNDYISGFCIDPQRNKMFWVSCCNPAQKVGVYKASLDGKNVEALVITGITSVGPPISTSVDATTGDLYYALDYDVVRVNPETKAKKRVLHLTGPGGKLDSIYVYGDRSEIYIRRGRDHGSVWRCRLDGTGLEKLFY